MRVATALTMSLAGLVAAVPWVARGSAFSDQRYRDRQKAAEILRSVLEASSGVEAMSSEVLERYRAAISILATGRTAHS